MTSHRDARINLMNVAGKHLKVVSCFHLGCGFSKDSLVQAHYRICSHHDAVGIHFFITSRTFSSEC